MKKKKYRITQISCDWKDNFTGKELSKAAKSVGGKAIFYDYDQMEVDEKVMFVSSNTLTDDQLDILWETGDLYTGDDIWSGSFEDILKKIDEYVKSCDEDDE